MEKPEKGTRAVDEYIRKAPAYARKMLGGLRRIVRGLAPAATEKISYGMPAFFLGRNLVYYAAHSAHVGLYPGARAVEAFERELAPYQHGRGSIRFPCGKPLPAGLVKRIMKFRLGEIAAKRK